MTPSELTHAGRRLDVGDLAIYKNEGVEWLVTVVRLPLRKGKRVIVSPEGWPGIRWSVEPDRLETA